MLDQQSTDAEIPSQLGVRSLSTLLHSASCAAGHFIRTSRCGTGLQDSSKHEARRW
jgi:hypothetical protein